MSRASPRLERAREHAYASLLKTVETGNKAQISAALRVVEKANWSARMDIMWGSGRYIAGKEREQLAPTSPTQQEMF